MFKQGISPSSIADIMSKMLKENGKEGHFLAQLIRNMNVKIQTTMDMAAGVDKNWSIVHHTLKKLNECANCASSLLL